MRLTNSNPTFMQKNKDKLTVIKERINLSKDFIEQATSANIDNEIVSTGLNFTREEAQVALDEISTEVAQAVLAAEQEAKANDAIYLFGSKINPPFRKRR